MVADDDSFCDYCSEKCGLETGVGRKIHIVWIGRGIIGVGGTVAVVLGAYEGAGVHHFPDHLLIAGGNDPAFGDDIEGKNILAGSDGNFAFVAGDFILIAAGADEQPGPGPCVASGDAADLSGVGIAGVFHEVFGEQHFIGRAVLLYDGNGTGVDSGGLVDDGFQGADQQEFVGALSDSVDSELELAGLPAVRICGAVREGNYRGADGEWTVSACDDRAVADGL